MTYKQMIAALLTGLLTAAACPVTNAAVFSEFEVYRPILETYYTAATEHWDIAHYMQDPLLTTEREYTDPLQTGFLFRDVNADGVRELLIGISDSTENGSFTEMYAISDGKPIHAITSWNRFTYWLGTDGDIYNLASNGAAHSCYIRGRLRPALIQAPAFTRVNPNLDVQEMLYCDLSESPAQLFFWQYYRDPVDFSCIDSGVVNPEAEITNEEAQRIRNEWEADAVLLPLTPFTDCQALMTPRQRDDIRAYQSVLDVIYSGLQEKRSYAEWYEIGWNTEYVYLENDKPTPLRTVGYGFRDLNGDGVDELLIGETDSPGSYLDLFTLDNGQPRHVCYGKNQSVRTSGWIGKDNIVYWALVNDHGDSIRYQCSALDPAAEGFRRIENEIVHDSNGYFTHNGKTISEDMFQQTRDDWLADREPLYFTMFQCYPSELEAVLYPCGDANADGSTDIADLLLLQKWLCAAPDAALHDWYACDMDGNGLLNANDAVLMKRRLLA